MRVLFVVKNMRLSNGVSSYAMNYYRNMVCDNFHYDFLIINDVGSPYYEEIKKTGGRIFLSPSYKKKPQDLVLYLNDLFRENNFDIVHCNVINSGSIVLMMAKKYGVKVRILHSHASQTGDKTWKKIRNKLFYTVTLKYATTYFACSKLAGDCLFGKHEYYVIPNAIDIDKYMFSEEKRNEIRKKLGVENCKVLMTVGRLTHQKNPYFIVDIITEYAKTHDDFVFWWFGNGELEDKIKDYAKNNDVLDKILFWGAYTNVNECYSAADIFILPSIYEGLPLVGIEAQMSALPIIFSDNITKEAAISDFVRYLSLENPIQWCLLIDDIMKIDRNVCKQTIKYHEWDIKKRALELYKVYHNLIDQES